MNNSYSLNALTLSIAAHQVPARSGTGVAGFAELGAGQCEEVLMATAADCYNDLDFPVRAVEGKLEEIKNENHKKTNENHNTTKDGWDKAKVVATFLSSVVIASLGALITYTVQTQQQQSQANQFLYQQRSQATQFVAELQSSRERSDAEIRARMFEALVKQFFTGNLDHRKKMMLFSLLEANFQEYFNSGPLFSQMESELNDGERDEMSASARSIAERQELALGAGRTPPRTLMVGQSVVCTVGRHKLVLGLRKIARDNEEVEVKLSPSREDTSGINFREIVFHVNYFDFPLMDNTALPDGHRFAVTLKNIDRKNQSAQLKLFEFDPDFISARDRPAFTEMKHMIERTVASNSAHSDGDRD